MGKPETLHIDVDIEEDGRFLASIPTLPGVMAYSETREAAIRKAKTIALQILADMWIVANPPAIGCSLRGLTAYAATKAQILKGGLRSSTIESR